MGNRINININQIHRLVKVYELSCFKHSSEVPESVHLRCIFIRQYVKLAKKYFRTNSQVSNQLGLLIIKESYKSISVMTIISQSLTVSLSVSFRLDVLASIRYRRISPL
jgi:hypothetical protein